MGSTVKMEKLKNPRDCGFLGPKSMVKVLLPRADEISPGAVR